VWHSMFAVQVPIAEKILRTVLVYATILILFRLTGKRDLATLNIFDFVVLFLLSNVVQNAIIGNDNSLAGGLLGAAILLAINGVFVRTVRLSRVAVEVFEGMPTVLIQDGKLDRRAVNRLGLREEEVMTAIHRQGASTLDEVEQATLTPGGGILVELRPEAMDATKGDLARLEAKLDRLTEMLERRQP